MAVKQSVKDWYAAEVKERMEEAGLRSYHMAYYCQMKHAGIYQYLSGAVIPDPWRLVLMAERLDCCVNDLLGYEDVEDVSVFESCQASVMFADERQYATCLADRLKRYFNERGLTIERVSELTGITVVTIKRWMGVRPALPQISQFLRLVDALDCTPSDLLGY